MRVTLSFNSNALPQRLASSVKALAAAPGRLEWWSLARERALFSFLHLRQGLGRQSLHRQFSAQDVSRFAFCTSPSPLLPSLPWHLPADDGQLDGLLKGNLTVFGYSWAWAPDGSCWHRAPDTGALWPRRFFADIPVQRAADAGELLEAQVRLNFPADWELGKAPVRVNRMLTKHAQWKLNAGEEERDLVVTFDVNTSPTHADRLTPSDVHPFMNQAAAWISQQMGAIGV